MLRDATALYIHYTDCGDILRPQLGMLRDATELLYAYCGGILRPQLGIRRDTTALYRLWWYS